MKHRRRLHLVTLVATVVLSVAAQGADKSGVGPNTISSGPIANLSLRVASSKERSAKRKGFAPRSAASTGCSLPSASSLTTR